MIITLTLNPSLDRTIEVEQLDRGAVIRAVSSRVEPGGKGVNVTRALLANGVSSRPVLTCGGDDGHRLVRLLRREGVEPICVWIDKDTRSNLTLAEPDGTVTKVNEPGPELTTADFARVEAALLEQVAQPTTWVVVCGSMPPGLPAASVTSLCRQVIAAGVRLAVDTSGPALRAGAEAGAALLKPNRDELAEVVGRPLPGFDDVIAAAHELRSWGAGAVLVSLGADGAVLVDDDGILRGSAPVARPRSAVGAGDALLAGFLAAGAKGEPALAEALAWGAAAVSLPGSRMPGPADLQRDLVRLEPPARFDVAEPSRLVES